MRGAARPRALGIALVLAVVLTACGNGGEAERSPPPAEEGRPSSPAEIEIVEPPPGAVVDGESVPLEIELRGGRIVEKVATDIRPDEGHVHVALDGETLTLLGGSKEDLVDLAGRPLEPGEHLVEVEFVAADHGFFIPRVIATSTFTVE